MTLTSLFAVRFSGDVWSGPASPSLLRIEGDLFQDAVCGVSETCLCFSQRWAVYAKQEVRAQCREACEDPLRDRKIKQQRPFVVAEELNNEPSTAVEHQVQGDDATGRVLAQEEPIKDGKDQQIDG